MKPDFYSTTGAVVQELLAHIGHLVKPDLIREIEYLKIENQILRSKCPKRITTTPEEKYRLLRYGLALNGRIKKVINIVDYSTFRRWALSDQPKNIKDRRGRPGSIAKEIKDLIIQMAKDNPAWGYPRIRAELQKLFINIPSRNTVKAILRSHGLPCAPKRNIHTWDAYMKRTFRTLWACDFFSKTVWTLLGPKAFYILFFINIRTRQVRIAGITQRPNKKWMADIAKNLHLSVNGKTVLIRDRDTKFTKEFDRGLSKTGLEIKILPYRSPNLNSYAESWVSTIKRECLDYFAVFGRDHLVYLVRQYTDYFNGVRPHSGRTPDPPVTEGKIHSHSILGGLITTYERE